MAPRPLPSLVLFALAAALRLWHVWAISDQPIFTMHLGDAEGYDAWARRIAAGDWLGSTVFYQAPLYPYTLGVLHATVGASAWIVRSAQAIVGAVSCVVLARATATVLGPRAGLLAGAMLACYPPAIFFDTVVQKSVLDLVLLSGLLASLSAMAVEPRSSRAWTAGILLGLLALTRENALAFLAPIVGWMLLDRSEGWTIRRALVLPLLLGLLVVLLPVSLRNLVVGGTLLPTTSQLGANLYIGNNPGADGSYRPLRPGRSHVQFEQDDARAVAEAESGRPLGAAGVSAFFVAKVAAFVADEPGRWLALMWRKWVLFWNAVELADTEDQYAHAEWSPPLRLLGAVWHFGVLAPLAALGIVLTWHLGRLRIHRWLLATYVVSVVAFFVFARYRLPVAPMLMLFAAGGAVEAMPFLRRATPRGRSLAVAAAAVVAVFSNWPVVSANRMQAVTHYNVGTRLDRGGEPAGAELELERALELWPAFPEAHLRLGLIAGSRGALDRARDEFEAALTLNERLQPALTALGELALAQEHLAEADARLSRAVELDPLDGRAAHLLGRVRMRQNRYADAVALFERALTLDATVSDARLELGEALLARGDAAGARTALDAALRHDPSSARATHLLGRLDATENDLAGAERHYRAAIARDAYLAAAHVDLANVLARTGRLSDAEAVLRAARERMPDQIDIVGNLAIVLAAQGRLEEARPLFERAVEARPDSAATRRNLAVLLTRVGRLREAVTQLQAVVALQPTDPRGHAQLGVVLLQAGDRAGARRALEEALRLDPSSPDAKRGLEMLDASERR